jgi:transposase
LWGRLTRILDDPEVELSTNVAENSMRPVALGRRNWIHIGSKEAGPPLDCGNLPALGPAGA